MELDAVPIEFASTKVKAFVPSPKFTVADGLTVQVVLNVSVAPPTKFQVFVPAKLAGLPDVAAKARLFVFHEEGFEIDAPAPT